MKFALVNGNKVEATKGAKGLCPSCDSDLIAKCGELKVNHWAHKGNRSCDPWWESETEWHRAWKNQFPNDWQEVIYHADNGERHIADVKTHDGWALEFQHSHISSDERRSREAFYQHVVWVVDGKRRLRDADQFARVWKRGQSLSPLSQKRRISLLDGALLRDWIGSSAHVFFDFGDAQNLWWLFPASDDTRAYIQHILRDQFVKTHLAKSAHMKSAFDSLVENFFAFIAHYEPSLPKPSSPRVIQTPPNEHPRQPMLRRKFRL